MAKLIDKFGLLVDKKTEKKRRDTCQTCDEMQMRYGMPWCKNCGCNLTAKTKWKSQECPLNKW